MRPSPSLYGRPRVAALPQPSPLPVPPEQRAQVRARARGRLAWRGVLRGDDLFEVAGVLGGFAVEAFEIVQVSGPLVAAARRAVPPGDAAVGQQRGTGALPGV